MGSPNAEAYLASPSVVAASAIAGKISAPEIWENLNPISSINVNSKKETSDSEVSIIDGFPEKIEGEIIYCHQDNLNTDGIYPGKYTYIDEFTAEQQAEVAMENYDPEFQKIAQNGDVLVGGFNFGSGSSREQAATALKYRGIQMVIAGSFSETYKRNAINNGFLVIESPELVKDLKSKFGIDKLTVKSGVFAKINFKNSTLTAEDKNYSISPVGTAAQELIVVGGLENWVRKRI